MRVSTRVDLVQVVVAVEVVASGPVFLQEGPAILAHEVMDDRHRNHVLQLLQLAEDECSMRPRAGKRNVKVVSPGLSLEAAAATVCRLAGFRHKIPELRFGALEATARL